MEEISSDSAEIDEKMKINLLKNSRVNVFLYKLTASTQNVWRIGFSVKHWTHF